MGKFNVGMIRNIAVALILILLVQTFFALFCLNLKSKEKFGATHLLVLLNYFILVLIYVYFKAAKGRTDFLIYISILVFVTLFSYFIYNKIGR